MYVEIVWSTENMLLATFGYESLIWTRMVPESPRWLIANKRLEEAEEILRHAAHVNKAKLPEELFDEKEKEVRGGSPVTFSAILHSPTLLTRSAILFVNWLVHSCSVC